MPEAETQELFQEQVHQFPLPTHHFTMLADDVGRFLRVDADGTVSTSNDADDEAMWDPIEGGQFRHVTSGLTTDDEDWPGLHFTAIHGPAEMPGTSLAHFKQHGWVCLPNVLAAEIVEALEKVACTDRYEDRVFDLKTPAMCQSDAIARTAAEPVSLWLMRQYLGTREVRLGHPPSFAILGRDDGKRDVQGWHCDFPYLWGISGKSEENDGPVPYGRVPTSSGDTVLGIQRNVCISPFTKVGGATAYKLGSHATDHGPPREWGTGSTHFSPGYRAQHGLPYNGPDADIVEAPGGSIILYDARTWHRAGVNRTDKRRSALLQAMIPMYVMPFADTSKAYRELKASDGWQGLTVREQEEMRNLMVHYITGPGGRFAITTDPELSTELPAPQGPMRVG
jgi:hypothetical protein